MKLKVCGMRETQNIQAVAALAPDYMGFIFYKHSKRYVGLQFRISPEFPATIQRVGVFVNEPAAEVFKLAKEHQLSFVQLHGDETPEACTAIKMKGIGVIKAFRVDADFDFSETVPYQQAVDYFLFDTKGWQFGGNGIQFDWRILAKYDQQVPFFLSGGISPANVHEINELRKMNLHAMDVNSGVEDNPGLKNIDLIKEIKKNL